MDLLNKKPCFAAESLPISSLALFLSSFLPRQNKKVQTKILPISYSEGWRVSPGVRTKKKRYKKKMHVIPTIDKFLYIYICFCLRACVPFCCVFMITYVSPALNNWNLINNSFWIKNHDFWSTNHDL